jgi:hypothetical protein
MLKYFLKKYDARIQAGQQVQNKTQWQDLVNKAVDHIVCILQEIPLILRLAGSEA